MRAETRALPFVRREPAAILATVQTVLVLIATLTPISPGVQAAILAATGAVLALVTGWAVAPTRPALLYGVLQAGVPLAVLLGLSLPDGANAAILAVVAAALGLMTRASVSPAVVGMPAPRADGVL